MTPGRSHSLRMLTRMMILGSMTDATDAPLAPDALTLSDTGNHGAALVLALPRPDENPAAVYLAGLGSEKSRAGMRSALAAVVRVLGGGSIASFPWCSLRYQHATAARTRLAEEGCAPATVNKALSAVRGVAREAMRLGVMSSEDYARIQDVAAVRGHREPAGRALAAPELQALFATCDATTASGSRDAAILALLYATGLRRSEVAGLDVGHLDTSTGAIRVLGKGNKERTVYITNGAADALRGWLAVRGTAPGPLLYPFTAQGRAREGERMTDAGIAFVLARAAKRAGISEVSPHDLRRTMIGDMLDAGADIATVQRVAGHASPVTTSRYDRRGERAKLAAAALLRIPFGSGSTRTARRPRSAVGSRSGASS